MDKLKELIIGMLKENTGVHMLDSGGAYGRHWERNQKRDFDKEPACILEADNYQNVPTISISYNLYHYLVNYLEYDEVCEKFNKEFKDFCNLPKYKEESYYHCLGEWVKDKRFSEVDSINTYNHESLLDQVIQYTHFKYGGEDYIALQIHNGCDVRGGYTDPVIFIVPEMDYFCLAEFDCYLYAKYPLDPNQKILEGIEPPKESYCWDSDDCGYHWYGNDNEPELTKVLRVKDGKAYVEIGGKLLELHASVSEGY